MHNRSHLAISPSPSGRGLVAHHTEVAAPCCTVFSPPCRVPHGISVGVKNSGQIEQFGSRVAPDAQKHLLWQTVGRQMNSRLGSNPVWLNTAGAGVPWLHIRLDDRPKYYRHECYR